MNDDGYVHNNYSTFNCQSIQFIVTKYDEINKTNSFKPMKIMFLNLNDMYCHV